MSNEKKVSVVFLAVAASLMGISASAWGSVVAFIGACAVFGLCVWLERKQKAAIDDLHAQVKALEGKHATDVAELKNLIQSVAMPRGFGL